LHVAVLGGGLQGCCTALALADRGVKVTLFDRNASLLSRAAVANEGKIHLGYMYAADPGLATARVMMQGALAFAPTCRRWLGRPAFEVLSTPTVYVVHRDSQRTADQVGAYLADVHRLLCEAAAGRPDGYFRQDVLRAPRAWGAAEREAEFGPQVLAAFDTPEIAVNPIALAEAVRSAIAAQPGIEVRLNTEIEAVDTEGGRPGVRMGGARAVRDRFDHVVNALWDGRLAIDDTAGLKAPRPWMHRLKYGVCFRQRDIVCRRSATIVSGPFGEVVSYSDGEIYLTWYASCLQAISRELVPPPWSSDPGEPLRSRIIRDTFAALADIVLPLRAIDLARVDGLRVKGGVVLAWGETDIDDPASDLHRRWQIGVTSVGRFHSIDPGKLTMAPYFADICAARILGTA
jgi:glycine/D-amino acid oxidase-like deaminating enzyme